MTAEGALSHRTPLGDWLRLAVLLLALALCCVVGLVTPYLLGALGLVLAARAVLQGRGAMLLRSVGARLFLAAFGGLAVCFAITAQAPADVLLVFNFTMLALFGPLAMELEQGARAGNGRRVAELALLGAALALAMALFRLLVLGEARADSLMFGAILLGNTAILLGFLSLLGVLAAGPRRWLFVLGPVLGMLANALTGSRGPLLGIVPLIVVSALFIGRRQHWRPLVMLAVIIGGIAVAGGIVVLTQSRAASVISAMAMVTTPEQALATAATPLPDAAAAGASDPTANIRLILWRAGYEAFLEAPWLGHGWARLMAAVEPHLAPADKAYAELPQLHNDALNFAVAAGLAGLAIYLLLLATPLVAALRAPRDGQFELRLFGAALLVTSYGFAGLTDLMFGFEFHTALYVALAAIVVHYCRDRAPGAEGLP